MLGEIAGLTDASSHTWQESCGGLFELKVATGGCGREKSMMG